jgi:hypothetical protein
MEMGDLCGALERSAHLFIGRENSMPHVKWCEREGRWGERQKEGFLSSLSHQLTCKGFCYAFLGRRRVCSQKGILFLERILTIQIATSIQLQLISHELVQSSLLPPPFSLLPRPIPRAQSAPASLSRVSLLMP